MNTVNTFKSSTVLGLCAFMVVAMTDAPALSAQPSVSNFEIMKATDNKVWRLNKITGEISVCTLDGDRLVCTSSSEAMRPPVVSYEERAAERKRLDEERQASEMKMLDRVLTAVRSLFLDAQDSETQ